MSVAPSDFLNSAVQLGCSSDEMSQRNALSRAYYAAFHAAMLAIPHTNGGSAEQKGMHRRYLDQLQDHDSGSKERTIGTLLSQLYQRRVVADYRLRDSLRSDAVARQLDVARKVLELLN